MPMVTPICEWARHSGRNPEERVGQELQSDVTTQLQVFRLIHHTHPASANPAEYAVMGNRLLHGLGRRGHWRECYGGV
jgi:hypothetical protein